MPAPVYATPADVMARLRLAESSPDAGYVADCTDEANALVARWIVDDLEPSRWPTLEDVPAGVRNATVGVAIRCYRFKDTESDLSDTWGDQGQLRIPRDPLAGHTDRLAPYRPGAAWAPA